MEYLFIYGLQLANYIKVLAVIILIIPLVIMLFFCAGNCGSEVIVMINHTEKYALYEKIKEVSRMVKQKRKIKEILE